MSSAPFFACNTSDGRDSTSVARYIPDEQPAAHNEPNEQPAARDLLWRLTNGPRGTGWSFAFEDEYQLIEDARDEIELLRWQLAGAQGINRALRAIADQIDLGEEA